MLQMTYFTADLHFGHATVMLSCRPQFITVAEMNHYLIKQWNNKVTDEDTVYVLGDMFYHCPTDVILNVLCLLKGKKHLIIGNHDDSWLSQVDTLQFFESLDSLSIKNIDGHEITLCHYPLANWQHYQKAYMIHGHIHDDKDEPYWDYLVKNDLILNAGVEINNFEPVTLEELIENNKKWKKT